MPSRTHADHTRGQAGFIVSTELMLIAVILALGLITGWVKLRDQSLSEVNDTMAAIDAYILGSAPLWQTGGTSWIVGGAIVAPSASAPVTETWDGVSAPAAVETAPGSHVYKNSDGFLVYSATPTSE